MRVISGEFGGRILKAPNWRGTRPTTDKVKGAIFSALQGLLDLAGVDVLDLYAGSGALGIEAISRGANTAVFVEANLKSAAVIRSNVNELNITKQCEIIQQDVSKFLSQTNRQFSLILADPPYADCNPQLLKVISNGNLLQSNGVLIVETSSDFEFEGTSCLASIKQKIYGDTKVSFWRKSDV